MLQDVQRPLHEVGDHLLVDDARGPDFGREGRDADVSEGNGQQSRVAGKVEDLPDREELGHRAHLRLVHGRQEEVDHVHAGRRRVEVNGVVGVGREELTEDQGRVPGRGGAAVRVAGPFAVDVDQAEAAAGVGPPPLHAEQGGA